MENYFNMIWKPLTHDWNIEFKDDNNWIMASGKTIDDCFDNWKHKYLNKMDNKIVDKYLDDRVLINLDSEEATNKFIEETN